MKKALLKMKEEGKIAEITTIEERNKGKIYLQKPKKHRNDQRKEATILAPPYVQKWKKKLYERKTTILEF